VVLVLYKRRCTEVEHRPGRTGRTGARRRAEGNREALRRDSR
jgi:hypothetical protein